MLNVCPDAQDLGQLDDAINVASALLYVWSGRKYSGSCTSTIRPYPQIGRDPGHRPLFGWFAGISSDVVNLDNPPVTSIGSVKVDGVVVPASEYKLYDGHALYAVNGRSWPCNQDLGLADTEPCTFSITYNHGVLPGAAGLRACAEFACELVRSWNGKKSCLPDRVTSLTRQGLSVVVSDPTDMWSKGQTGIPKVDMFILAENPHGYQGRARVFNADQYPARTST